jgi:hypothetical protein
MGESGSPQSDKSWKTGGSTKTASGLVKEAIVISSEPTKPGTNMLKEITSESKQVTSTATTGLPTETKEIRTSVKLMAGLSREAPRKIDHQVHHLDHLI